MDTVLIVLYSNIDNGNQTWCAYYGLEKEADEEKTLMEGDGYLEVFRFRALLKRNPPYEIQKI